MGNTNDISEEMAINIVKEFTDNTMYILLSTVQANMMQGYSYPYVKEIDDNGKLLFIFSSLDYAKEFIHLNDFEVLDGIYPLAKIEPNDPLNSIEKICAIAAHLGIMYIDFNPAHPNISMGVTIPWLQKCFGYDLTKISMYVNPAMKDKLANGGINNMEIGFNPMPIYDFRDPYTITAERREVLDKIPTAHKRSIKGFFEDIRYLGVPELIYVSNLLTKTFIPRANTEADSKALEMFVAMLHVLDGAIIQAMDQLTTYTLLDGEDMLINHNKAAYLIYTDRFQYMGEYRYKEVPLDGFLRRLQMNEVNYVYITAGPGQMHLTTPQAIEEIVRKKR